MFRKMKSGSTSQSVPIFVQDSSSTVGAGLGSLVYNTASLAAKYRRQGESSWTTITLATMTLGTWASGGFVSDGGPVTGTYELGLPNAVLASGAEWAEVVVYGATNMLPVLVFIELDAVNYQSATAFITGVNSMAPPANWNTFALGVGGTVTVGTVNDDAINNLSISQYTYEVIATYVRTELATELARIDVATSTRLATASYTAAPTTAQIADKVLGRNIAGSSDGGRTVTEALRVLRNRWTRTATTLTVYAEDDSTTSWTSVLTTSDTLDPVSESNP
jgi:hypothetical protein